MGDWQDSRTLCLLGQNIAAYRKKRKMSQLKLAIAAGVSKSYLCDLEHGRRNTTVIIIAKIAAVLGVKVGSLFAGI